MTTKTEKAKTKPTQKATERKDDDQGDDLPAAPAGYVYVTRAEPNAATPDDEDRPAGYVHIPGEEEPRLVDEKSLPELEVLGYRVVS